MKLNLFTTPPAAQPQTSAKRNEYASPVGWWRVTTEGDVEGRTTKELGVYYGHVAEIAFFLANQVYYSLAFKPHNAPPPSSAPSYYPSRRSVFIHLGIDSGTWDLRGEDRARWFEKWLDVTDPKIEVSERNPSGVVYYASVYISLEESECAMQQKLRNQALAKLTPSEKKVLGLE